MDMHGGNLMRNPQERFRDPQKILEDKKLSNKQKIKLLMNWRADLLELQRADGENMQASAGHSGDLAVELQNVTDALQTLDADPRTGQEV